MHTDLATKIIFELQRVKVGGGSRAQAVLKSHRGRKKGHEKLHFFF